MTDQVTEEVYQFICAYMAQHGYAPSLREIGSGCYIGRSTVIRHLDKLEAHGWITREPHTPRSIALVRQPT